MIKATLLYALMSVALATCRHLEGFGSPIPGG